MTNEASRNILKAALINAQTEAAACARASVEHDTELLVDVAEQLETEVESIIRNI